MSLLPNLDVKLAKRRTVLLAHRERGNGGEGAIMAYFIRGGFLAMIVSYFNVCG